MSEKSWEPSGCKIAENLGSHRVLSKARLFGRTLRSLKLLLAFLGRGVEEL